jgi:hypothetical protein
MEREPELVPPMDFEDRVVRARRGIENGSWPAVSDEMMPSKPRSSSFRAAAAMPPIPKYTGSNVKL